jgi:hypothetical protein
MNRPWPYCRLMSKRVHISVLMILPLIVCFGCFNPFSPSVIGPSSIKPIARQTDPDSVLHNFKYAYENRDSIVYENLLDKDFIFIYRDLDRVVGTEVTVEIPRDGRGGDLYVTRALFRTFDEIRLDTWIVRPGPDSVGQETWKARRVTFHLSLRDTDGDYDYLHMEATGFAEFLFRQSEEDKLWRIVRWIDRST